MGIWSRFFGKKDEEPKGEGSAARWIAADDPGNPFGVPILDLMSNLQMISTSRSPEEAERAVSWRPGSQRSLDCEVSGEVFPCDLRYPAATELPEGLLYRPREMEDKWALIYRDQAITAVRSWTGLPLARADVHHEGSELRIRQLTLHPDSGLGSLGDPVRAFDWLIRSHGLGSRIPFPISSEGGALLKNKPLVAFHHYGRHVFCAAEDHEPAAVDGQLVSDGDLVAAVTAGNLEAVRSSLRAGEPINAPTSFSEGGTVLHLALHLSPALVTPLIAAGADVNRPSRRGSTPLMAAVAAGASDDVLRELLETGAALDEADSLGFSALHVAAQFGRVGALTLLAARGADLTCTTQMGHMPLHVAAGTNQREALEWFVEHGFDMSTPSPMGSVVEIARSEGHGELATWLESLE